MDKLDPFDFTNIHFGGSLLENPESSNPIHLAQQTITGLAPFGTQFAPLPNGITDATSVGALPVTQSIQQQIAGPFFEGFAPDLFVAAVQSSATSSQIQPSFVSSSISPTSENTQDKTKKVSKRKQLEDTNSAKGKRKKSTSSKSVKAKPSSTEPDPLLKAIQAFQGLEKVERGCIVKALTNAGMSVTHKEIGKLTKHITAIADCVHYEEAKGTIPGEALKEICANRRVGQKRIEKFLLLIDNPEDRAIYLEYHKNKSNPPSLLKALQAFHVGQDAKRGCIVKALKSCGMSDSDKERCYLEKYVKTIADYFYHEEMHGTVPDEAFQIICNSHGGGVSKPKVLELLEVARPEKKLYLTYRDNYLAYRNQKNAPKVVKKRLTRKQVRAKASSTKPDEYEPIIRTFQECNGTRELSDIAKEYMDPNPQKVGAVRRYINVIARCLDYENTNNTIISNLSDPILESFCGPLCAADRVLKLLPVARPKILFYVEYYKST